MKAARAAAVLLTAAQAGAALTAWTRLARGRDRLPPLAPAHAPPAKVSVVIPARDEEARLGPCLRAVLADPHVAEAVVVDDGSTDGTAALAASLGARVVPGAPPPPGWVGKQWALRQGVEAARGPVVVALDADTRPRPGLVSALCAALERHDLVSAAPRFVCAGPVAQALQAAFLTTLVYRFGPVGAAVPPPAHRMLANGQCTAFRREEMRAADGYTAIRGNLTDDVALARALARGGWRVGFLDAGGLLDVEMYASPREIWREWPRSLPLRDVTSPVALAGDLAVVWLTCGLPVVRLFGRRAEPLDLALLATRLLLTAALRGSFARPGPGVWLSPLLDPLAAARLTWTAVRPVRTWRGRAYPAPGRHRAAARAGRRGRPGRTGAR
ncbi:glycosyltransferase family 2 protein [Actinocorallia aurea]